MEGESDTRAKADASARARNAATEGKSLGLLLKSSLVLFEHLEKFVTKTSRDVGHDHKLDLPEDLRAGTYVTKPARSRGAVRKHVHVAVIREGARASSRVVTSRGVDGHTHDVVLAARASAAFRRSLSKAADISGENSAQVAGADSLRQESVEGRGKGKKRKGRGYKRLKKAATEPGIFVKT